MPSTTVYTIRLLKFDIDAELQKKFASLGTDDRIYAIAAVGLPGALRVFGRSSRIASNAASFDFEKERLVWEEEVICDGAAVPEVHLDIWVDAGKSSSTTPYSLLATIDTTVAEGTRQLTSTKHNCTLTYSLTKVALPPDPSTVKPVPIHSSNAPQTNQSTIDNKPTVVLEFTEVKGLYKPVRYDENSKQPGEPLSAKPLSEYTQGYTSLDHQGRIFLNRKPDGAYERGTQFIQITVRLTQSNLKGQPNKKKRDGMKVKWSAFVPDDYTDDDYKIYRGAGQYLDPTDYNAGVHQGAAGFDNYGEMAKGLWADAYGYATSNMNFTDPPPSSRIAPQTGNPNRRMIWTIESETKLVSEDAGLFFRESKILAHCPDVRGDQLIIRADVDDASRQIPDIRVVPARTGAMTMWERIEVEYRKVEGAVDLPIARVPKYFESIWVQFDFQALPEVKEKTADELKQIPNSEFQKFFSRKDVFLNRKEPSWFCVIAAKFIGGDPFSPVKVYEDVPGFLGDAEHELLDTNPPGPATTRTTAREPYEYIDVRHPVGSLKKYGVLIKMGVSGGGQKFGVAKVTEINLLAHDTPEGVKQRLRMLGYEIDGVDNSAFLNGTKNQLAFDKALSDYPEIKKYLETPKRADPLPEFQQLVHWLYVELAVTNATAPTFSAIQQALLTPAKAYRLWISPHDIQNDFTAGGPLETGKIAHANSNRLFFGPRFRVTQKGGKFFALDAKGYLSKLNGPVPQKFDVTINEIGLSPSWLGYSPESTVSKKNDYFGALAIVGTQNSGFKGKPAEIASLQVITMVHELTHAFGFPHKCGKFDMMLGQTNGCNMNYNNHWYVDDADELIPDSGGSFNDLWCWRHFRELRQVKLKNNVLLQACNW